MVASFPMTGNTGEGVRWGEEDKEKVSIALGQHIQVEKPNTQLDILYIYPRGEKWAQD